MSSYQEEKTELFEWASKELERIDKECPPEPGLDGKHTTESKKAFKGFNRRLLALKDKYGIDVAATG